MNLFNYFCFNLQHILYNHTPWFIKEYGSLSIWSTQGMEKSHYVARSRYFRHTRHGGGKNKANSLLEVFQWFYRQILHQKDTSAKKLAYETSDTYRALQDLIAKRKSAYNNSSAKGRFYNWLGNRQREGKKWRLRSLQDNHISTFQASP